MQPNIVFEPLREQALFAQLPMPAAEGIEGAIARAIARVGRSLPDFRQSFPAPSSEGQMYPAMDNSEWTNGFWTGILWLSWQLTGSQDYRTAAELQVADFLERARREVNVAHHDLGFLYTPSACAAWQLTGSEAGRVAGLLAADLLMRRYDPTTGVIQAWGDLTDPAESGRMIMDCNLNLPLLYWASRETGRAVYRQAADRHLAQAERYLVRPDGSTFHTFHMDTQTGAPLRGTTHQGFADDSCWSRGQAWGIYGFTLGYALSGRERLVALAKKLANYFINRCDETLVPRWDLIFDGGSDEPYDTSAAAVAACGLLELVRHLPLGDPHRDLYARIAWAMVEQLDRAHLAALDTSNGLLADGVYHMPKRIGVGECCLWGDYFYLEALIRLRQVWVPYWL
ncbi:glycoside hydrolase family 88 protein [Croceibacterium sp. TMG7-5b_MA50]|uniref:glycoside hydrolase family 88 protein n=1 Tax=Croceibacterium sp. TMG7-5b_MA50 TaxID=3121290 RepID=UPI0032214C9D